MNSDLGFYQAFLELNMLKQRMFGGLFLPLISWRGTEPKQLSPLSDELKASISKKITHMWSRWGAPQNFFLAFIDELKKQIIIKKTVEVGQ